MFYKKKYIMMFVCLAISSSIVTWIILYGDFSRTVPIRAKQVFYLSENGEMPQKN